MNLINFPVFLVLWNRAQGFNTPLLHLQIAQWLEAQWYSGNHRLLLMAFRAAGKSTIVGLFAAWLLLLNPNHRILVLAADLTLAKKMVRVVKRIIERHPLTSKLKPKSPDQWGAQQFTINRPQELRDPSMLAHGILSNITGTRADIIICDDVEVPKTCDTASKRAALREHLLELDFILTPDGTQLYVGTPHTYFSIYAEQPRAELGEHVPFLHGFDRLLIPILNTAGESVWPARFSNADIDRIKAHSGPAKFNSQMLLQAVNIAEARLEPELLVPYNAELDYTEANRTPRLLLGGTEMVGSCAWWDPAFAGSGHDRSVLAILYVDAAGLYYLHRIHYLQIDQRNLEDNATQQCKLIGQYIKDVHIRCVLVETNGIGQFLPGLLRKTFAEQRVHCTVRPMNTIGNKEARIIESFDAPLAARALHAHQSIWQTPFIHEMREWQPGRHQHDDGLDAVASAIKHLPIRMGSKFFT